MLAAKHSSELQARARVASKAESRVRWARCQRACNDGKQQTSVRARACERACACERARGRAIRAGTVVHRRRRTPRIMPRSLRTQAHARAQLAWYSHLRLHCARACVSLRACACAAFVAVASGVPSSCHVCVSHPRVLPCARAAAAAAAQNKPHNTRALPPHAAQHAVCTRRVYVLGSVRVGFAKQHGHLALPGANPCGGQGGR